MPSQFCIPRYNAKLDIMPPPEPTLHHLTSSQSLRVLWALEELAAAGHPFKLEVHSRVAQRAPESLKKLSPLGKSPILIIPSTDATGHAPLAQAAHGDENGEIVLGESRVILQFLADEYSNGIWKPSTPGDRLRDTYWAEFANASLAPFQMIMLIFEMIPSQSPALLRGLLGLMMRGIVGKLKGEVVPLWELMERALQEKEWFAGKKMGVADLNMSWPMDVSTQRGWFGVEEARKYPKIKAWVDRVHDRPAYKKALESGGIYDLKTLK